MAIPVSELVRYVPKYVCDRIARDPELKAREYSDRWIAAALFADISGFTPLSERLTAQGADGVEQLTQTLNAYFGRLIDLINAHGGDVGRFAGDALLAYWTLTDDTRLTEVTRLAAQCGLRMQEALESFEAPTGDRLYLKVGIGAGEIFTVSMGGVFSRYDCVVTGPGVVEAAKAAAACQPGMVGVGARAWEIVGPVGRGEPIDDHFMRLHEMHEAYEPVRLAVPELPEDAVPALLSYIPASIHRRLEAKQSAWIAELRRVTVVFVTLPSLDYKVTIEDAQVVMQAVQEEIYRFRGSLNKLGADEKGVAIVAALGLPGASHEDDEVRGALIGFNIKQRLDALGLPGAVGVNSGTTFCGTVGSEIRCEYSIIGDVINTSARLMAASKGGVLAGETTWKRAQRGVAWEALPPIKMKGKAGPQNVYRPLGVAKAAERARAGQKMVGRTRELGEITRMLDLLGQECRGGVLALVGQAGLGKSRMVEAVLEAAVARPIALLQGAADSLQRATSYYAWRPVFAALLGLTAGMPLDEQRRKVLEALAFDPELVQRAPLIDVVLGLEMPDNELTRHMFGEARVISTNHLLTRLLARRAAERPLLVVLEDTHWMDSASWTLATRVAREIPSLLLVLVTRPVASMESAPSVVAAPSLLGAPPPSRIGMAPPGTTGARESVPAQAIGLMESMSTRTITLQPLSGDESLKLAEQRLGVDRLPPLLADVLRTRSQGNPFFAQELASALLAAGRIAVADGVCTVPDDFDPEKLSLPDSLQGVVTSRIDRLDVPEQLTLKVASVVGRTFGPAIITDVCPIEEDRPYQRENLRGLVEHQLLDSEGGVVDPIFSFHHAITQDVAYQLMPPAQRRALHQAIAEWYEKAGGDLTPLYPLLAKHWSNTDRTAKALEYLEKSGQNALRDYANEEAVSFFRQALAIAKQAGGIDEYRRATWERQLAEAHYNLGHLNKALTHFQSALKLLGDPFPESTLGMLGSTMWAMAKQLAHRLAPSFFVGRAGGDAPRRIEAARAYERLAQIRYLNNATLPTVHASFKSLNHSEAAGDSAELARSYANAAVVHGLLMLHGTARGHTERARRVAATVNQKSCEAYVEFICGVYLVTVAEWDLAEAHLTRAVSIAADIAESRRWYESAFTLANTLSRRGHIARSIAVAASVADGGRRRGVAQVEVWGLAWELWGRLTIVADPERMAVLERELAACLARKSDMPLADHILGHAILALAHHRRGRAPEARASADAAREIIERTGAVSHYLLAAYAALAEVYAGLAAINELSTIANVLWMFKMMYPIGAPRASMAAALLAEAKGKPAKARAKWQRMLEQARELRMPCEELVAHQKLGNEVEARAIMDRLRIRDDREKIRNSSGF